MKEITLPNGVLLKPIPVAPNDDYMAGDDGQIYSRFRYKGEGKALYRDWYPLKAWPDNRGWYRHVTISHNNVRITKAVHTLICIAFHGQKPFASAQVRHLDSNDQNNRPDNLAWGTRSENWTDRRSNKQRNEGEANRNSKITNFERSALRWAVNRGLCSQHHAARILGINQRTVGVIAKSKIDWGFGI